jgi:predicted transcriptional regulator
MADKTEIEQPVRVLSLTAGESDLAALQAVTRALASSKRLAILHFLSNHTCSVHEIAQALNLPASTATLHINILEKAGLIKTDLQPATRGLQKMCARVYDQVVIELPLAPGQNEATSEISMPIGAYSDLSISATCGILKETGIIGHLDDPAAFYEPEHIHAQLLWFRKGWVEYRFPNRLPPDAVLDALELSLEACSEAPLHHDDWPSDISVWVNGHLLGTWTCPGDFGGQRGALTPAWWDTHNSQYGLLKIWRVTAQGSFVDGRQVSAVNLARLGLEPGVPIPVRIGVRDDAYNQGGLNLFGRKFGNYPQDIILRQRFRRGELR